MMKNYFTSLVAAITGEYFPPFIGLTYIIVKIVLRHIIHKAIDHVYDFWGVISWFSVDITLLALSVCAASNVPARLKLDHQQSIFWYVIFVVLFILAAFLYLFFVKRRNQLDKGKAEGAAKVLPYQDAGLFIYLSCGWFIGFALFWATLNALR